MIRYTVALFVMLTCWALPAFAQTASQLTIAWDYVDSTGKPLPAPAGGFHITRCTPPTGQQSCTPSTMLETPPPQGGNVLQQFWVDKTVVPGTLYCYGVQAFDAQRNLSAMATKDSAGNLTCKVAPVPPIPAPTNVRFQ